jgi:hypothetical protein
MILRRGETFPKHIYFFISHVLAYEFVYKDML